MLSPSAAIVQRHDPERFLTALFAPGSVRETLLTLYAFNHELARANEVASVPALALIRLHWWREVVEGADRAHPIAAPLRAAILSGALQRGALLDLIDAREIETEESVDLTRFDTYLHTSAGGLMREAGRLLGAHTSLAALQRLGAGCGAVGVWRNRAARTAARTGFADDLSDQAIIARAADLLGHPQRWPAEALPAALPAVVARRRLRQPRQGPPSTADRLAVWAAAMRRRV
jgi:phytoene synthase